MDNNNEPKTAPQSYKPRLDCDIGPIEHSIFLRLLYSPGDRGYDVLLVWYREMLLYFRQVAVSGWLFMCTSGGSSRR